MDSRNWSRREVLARAGVLTALQALPRNVRTATLGKAASSQPLSTALRKQPVWVYDPWSAYTDYEPEWRQMVDGAPNAPAHVRLTEGLALRELDALAAMRAHGVRIDYFHMNGFWFDADGGYRAFRKADWPQGPDRWLERCRALDIQPGLWMGTNLFWQINVAPAWKDSLASKPNVGLPSASLFEGGYLADFMTVLGYWYARGVRMFDLDILDLDAATSEARRRFTPAQIREKNRAALLEALKMFRQSHPDVVLTSYTGYFSTDEQGIAYDTLDVRWLEAFDAMMCGEATVSNTPQASFVRALDLGPDPAIRNYVDHGIPLSRIDPLGALFSTTWYGYHRGKMGWKGMVLLTAARGSRKQKLWGAVSLLNGEDHCWLSKVQRAYERVGRTASTALLGGHPDRGEPYGYATVNGADSLCTVVNPAQAVRSIELDVVKTRSPARLLFHDAGFVPTLNADRLTLGPGQMAVIGFGQLARQEHDLGIQTDVRIPNELSPLSVEFAPTQWGIRGKLESPRGKDLRVLIRQTRNGAPLRSKAGVLRVTQGEREVPVHRADAEPLFVGNSTAYAASWVGGEVSSTDLGEGPVEIHYELPGELAVNLAAEVFAVHYDG